MCQEISNLARLLGQGLIQRTEYVSRMEKLTQKEPEDVSRPTAISERTRSCTYSPYDLFDDSAPQVEKSPYVVYSPVTSHDIIPVDIISCENSVSPPLSSSSLMNNSIMDSSVLISPVRGEQTNFFPTAPGNRFSVPELDEPVTPYTPPAQVPFSTTTSPANGSAFFSNNGDTFGAGFGQTSLNQFSVPVFGDGISFSQSSGQTAEVPKWENFTFQSNNSSFAEQLNKNMGWAATEPVPAPKFQFAAPTPSKTKSPKKKSPGKPKKRVAPTLLQKRVVSNPSTIFSPSPAPPSNVPVGDAELDLQSIIPSDWYDKIAPVLSAPDMRVSLILLQRTLIQD